MNNPTFKNDGKPSAIKPKPLKELHPKDKILPVLKPIDVNTLNCGMNGNTGELRPCNVQFENEQLPGFQLEDKVVEGLYYKEMGKELRKALADIEESESDTRKLKEKLEIMGGELAEVQEKLATSRATIEDLIEQNEDLRNKNRNQEETIQQQLVEFKSPLVFGEDMKPLNLRPTTSTNQHTETPGRAGPVVEQTCQPIQQEDTTTLGMKRSALGEDTTASEGQPSPSGEDTTASEGQPSPSGEDTTALGVQLTTSREGTTASGGQPST